LFAAQEKHQHVFRLVVSLRVYVEVLAAVGADPLAVAGDGDVAADVGLGQQVENCCDVTGFDVGKDHPGVRPDAVVPSAGRQPVHDTALLEVAGLGDCHRRREVLQRY
jgi:hypothetical protein